MKVACELVPVLNINWRNYSKNVLFVGFKKKTYIMRVSSLFRIMAKETRLLHV